MFVDQKDAVIFMGNVSCHLPWTNAYHLDALQLLSRSEAPRKAYDGVLCGAVDGCRILLAVTSNRAHNSYHTLFVLAQ